MLGWRRVARRNLADIGVCVLLRMPGRSRGRPGVSDDTEGPPRAYHGGHTEEAQRRLRVGAVRDELEHLGRVWINEERPLEGAPADAERGRGKDQVGGGLEVLEQSGSRAKCEEPVRGRSQSSSNAGRRDGDMASVADFAEAATRTADFSSSFMKRAFVNSTYSDARAERRTSTGRTSTTSCSTKSFPAASDQYFLATGTTSVPSCFSRMCRTSCVGSEARPPPVAEYLRLGWSGVGRAVSGTRMLRGGWIESV